MVTPRKFWFVLIGAILTLAVIACSCNSILPSATLTPVPTMVPPTAVPPTALPSPTIAPTLAPAPATGLAGSWQDPVTGTVTTVIALDGGYTVDSVVNPGRGGNELASTSWANGILTWMYCVPDGNCVTTEAIPPNGDSLSTNWSNFSGYSGSATMQRVASAPPLDEGPVPGMAGRWLDPDTTDGDYHVIVWENGEYIVSASIIPSINENLVTSSTWTNGVLTWIYCVPNRACVTNETVSVSDGGLYTTWSNDQGGSGSTTMQRMP